MQNGGGRVKSVSRTIGYFTAVHALFLVLIFTQLLVLNGYSDKTEKMAENNAVFLLGHTIVHEKLTAQTTCLPGNPIIFSARTSTTKSRSKKKTKTKNK